jgi:NADPH:quinone reductase-like Zn-dependent oxidoreductase
MGSMTGSMGVEEGTMRAVVQRRYGPSGVLECTEVDRPTPGARDVLVRVHAAAVHPGDHFIMIGVPYVVRMAYGLRRPRHGVRGRDLAGRIDAVGADVRNFQVGDEVFGWSTTGTLAECVCVPADNLARKPASLSMEQAAAVATSAITALQALRDVARVRPGQTVLVTGASGGVGTFAVQIAKALGAEVTGVCSTRNVDLVRSLGADHVIDYTQTEFTSTGRRYDVILDNIEAQSLAVTRRALAPTGILIPNSGRGGRWIGPLGRIAKARFLSVFSRQALRPFLSRERQQDLVALAELIEAGKVTPVVDRTYRLDQAAAALDHVGQGHTRGKVVITVGTTQHPGREPRPSPVRPPPWWPEQPRKDTP